MSVDDVAASLIAMQDEGVRTRVRGGDLGAVGEREFTDEESQLVRAAAEDIPEVEAFSMSSGGAPAMRYVVANQTSMTPAPAGAFESHAQPAMRMPNFSLASPGMLG
jgi:hypothetical protein